MLGSLRDSWQSSGSQDIRHVWCVCVKQITSLQWHFSLILTGLELGLPRHKVAMVTSYALSLVVEYLSSEECMCREDLNLSSSGQLMTLLRSLLSSKGAVCRLSNVELDHVASLLLQA